MNKLQYSTVGLDGNILDFPLIHIAGNLVRISVRNVYSDFQFLYFFSWNILRSFCAELYTMVNYLRLPEL